MSEVSSVAATAGKVPQSDKAEEPSALAATLGQMSRALETAVGIDSPLIVRLRALRERLRHERLQLAVLGQFKRGKSSFINALIGAALLPTGVLPLTALATFIAWRREPRVVVGFTNGQSQQFDVRAINEIRNILFRFVAEEANPENRLGVARIDLYYPADILADGTVIIDTPGVGSTFRHNTRAALQVLTECDAAFFIVSADPPITEVETEFLRRIKSMTARIFFVLNKTDYLREEERRAAATFLQKVLSERMLMAPDDRILCISARNGLEAKLANDAATLETSGLAALEDHVVRTLANRKRNWLEEAVRGKALGILSQASAELDLRIRTLEMPIEELAAKADAFRDALRSIEEQRRVTAYLLDGDHRRLRLALDSRVDDLRREIAAKLASIIAASLSDNVPTAWEGAMQSALAGAMRDAFEGAREPLASAIAADTEAALHASQERIDIVVDRVRQVAAAIFDLPLSDAPERESFALGEDPYWVTESASETLIPDPSSLIDRLLPTNIRRARLQARMKRRAGELIVRNVENLRWAVWRGLDETFRKAIAQFEERLDEAIKLTRDVIEDALGRRKGQSFAVKPELDRLRSATASLSTLRRELQDNPHRNSASS